jgi:ATP-dependent RNA helicase SUPV3L1/SUV3
VKLFAGLGIMLFKSDHSPIYFNRPKATMTQLQPRILAVLGPTNTGKTHFAMERLLAHASGIIGFPLRLLARENYERALKIKGPGKVALITGEEKIIPPGAKYFLCTVESMPLDKPVHFLAIDEIQLCADAERGHVFTARLLYARGEEETLFLGAETIMPLIRKLVPETEFDKRPRFSTLSYSGPRKINRLPPQSALVAFSASDVYAIAEQVRRHRGGAAVVMGALSPRTRNAQVAMYQAGEVDHIVATDAIGMGLNMDVNHVAFAAIRKFDGKRSRPLSEPELAQIAGRAGRHMNDGTFGVTADAPAISPEMVESIEQHRFRPIKLIYWRNPSPELTSLETLKMSLCLPPKLPGLVRAGNADDEVALNLLAANKEITERATSPEAVAMLWEVCQIPDFRKVMSDAHTSLLGRIYLHLMDVNGLGKLPTDWISEHVQRLERADGNIETLTGRLANIRTWTYVAHRGDWLDDTDHWQERTRSVEDKLSDALHERLTQRFVDQRTSVLVKRLRNPDDMLAAVKRDGSVLVEGHAIGRLDGFRFIADESSEAGAAKKAIQQAARRALGPEIKRRVQALETASQSQITLSATGFIQFDSALIAHVSRGLEILSPSVEPVPSDLLDVDAYERISRRLKVWSQHHIAMNLKSLILARKAKLEGAARGLVFQLAENLGSLRRKAAKSQIDALTKEDRKRLRSLGIIIGRVGIYFPALLKPAPAQILGLLWVLWNAPDAPPEAPHPGRVSLPSDEFPAGYLDAIGYHRAGRLAVRLDIFERIAAHAWKLGYKGSFVADTQLLSLAGCGIEDMETILKEIGFSKSKETVSGVAYAIKRKRVKSVPRKSLQKNQRMKNVKVDPDSPFAKLKKIILQ